MAWAQFPVARGQRLTADMLNELRLAALDRGISTPAALSRGDSLSGLAAWMTSLRNNIKSAITSGTSGPYGYWSGSDWHNFTTGTSSGTTTNVFEDAFGAGVTDWQYTIPSSTIGLVDVMNEIYALLDNVRHYKQASMGGLHAVSVMNSRSASAASCSALLTAIKAATWGTVGATGNYAISLASATSGGEVRAARGYIPGTPPVGSSKTWVHISSLVYGMYSFAGSGSWYNLSRDIGLQVRGLSYTPATFAESLTGPLIASYSMASGTKEITPVQVLVEGGDVSISKGSLSRIFVVPTPESYADPTLSGICAIASGSYSREFFGSSKDLDSVAIDWCVHRILTDYAT